MRKFTLRDNIINYHDLFNDHYFGGGLNTPDFKFYDHYEVDQVGSVWGWYEFINNFSVIGLTVNDKIYETLLHEMIHQYQREFNLIDKDHGSTFRKYTRIIENDLKLEKGTI